MSGPTKNDLRYLAQLAKGPASPQQVAAALGFNRMTSAGGVARVLGRMMRLGLATFEIVDDARVSRFTITDAGRKALEP